jgi:hypothetical protein
VAAHQQVGSFEVVNRAGVLEKNGGNVASYFCTPDGRVIHAVTGPVPAEELLAAARWAVDVSSGGRAVDDPERIGAAHREEIEHPARPVASQAQQKVHRLLAAQPLAPLNEVYRTVFEEILGQRVSPPDTERVQAEHAFAAARRAKLPVLLILHKKRDSQTVLDEWNRLVSSPTTVGPLRTKEEAADAVDRVGRGGQVTLGPAAGSVWRRAPGASRLSPGIRYPAWSRTRPSVPPRASARELTTTTEITRVNPLRGLARSYVVVALPLEELPALSHQLGIPPYAAPEPGSPLFVVARSDARQLSAVTTWGKSQELAYAMAQGIVQEAKEHARTPEQLRALLAVVDPVDGGLGDEVRKLMSSPEQAGSHRAGQAGWPPKRA